MRLGKKPRQAFRRCLASRYGQDLNAADGAITKKFAKRIELWQRNGVAWLSDREDKSDRLHGLHRRLSLIDDARLPRDDGGDGGDNESDTKVESREAHSRQYIGKQWRFFESYAGEEIPFASINSASVTETRRFRASPPMAA